MATRMQQRRGTASQWSSANPILNVAEIGFETDTNKFKIGDGTNHWADLTYFVDAGQLADIIDGAPALLDTLNELAAAIGDDPSFMTTVATNLSNHASDTTSIHGITDTAELATKTFAAELLTNATKTNITITGDKNGLTISAENGVADSTTDNLTEGSTNKYFTDERAQDAVGNAVGTGLTYTDSTGAIAVDTTTIQARVADVSDTEIGYLNGVTSAIQTQIDAKASSTDLSNHASDTTSIHGITDTSKLVATNAVSTTLEGDLVVDGDFTVNGTNFAASATTIVIEDNMLQLAHQNSGNSIDLGVVVAYNETGTAYHSGIVRDVSDSKWKLFKGVTTEPTTTVDFTQGSLDDLAVAGLTASSISVGDVSNTEFGYLNGVTSAIQTQLDGKQGTVSGVSDTEIGYLDGVTSGIQTQLDAKINKSVVDAAGDLLIGTADNAVDRLAIGSSGYLLTSNGTTAQWQPAPASGPTVEEIIMGVW
jgi:hypothetical protein